MSLTLPLRWINPIRQRRHCGDSQKYWRLSAALPGRWGRYFWPLWCYSAWCGQPTDDIAALERRLDLARAGEAIDESDHPLCAALTEHTPHELGAQRTMPRMRIYRRIREMRLRLLTAGLGSAA